MTSAAARTGVAGAVPRTGPAPDAAAFLDAVLARYAGQPRTVVVTLPAPLAPLPMVFARLRASPAFVWEPAEEGQPGYAAAGIAHAVAPAGERRGAQARTASEGIAERMEAVYHPAVPPARPRWLGGLAFAAGGASSPPWEEFGDGRFVLPRWSYGRRGDRAWLAFAAAGEDLDPEARGAAAQALHALLTDLERSAGRWPEAAGAPSLSPVRVEHLPEARWAAQVDAIARAIDAGDVHKVVAARRSMVEAAAPIDPAVVLTRLGRRYPGCTRFAIRCGDATFVGATPERLVMRAGRRVRTEAMAGSVAHGAAASLLASDKDRREHDMVVRTLLERLGPYCDDLEPGAAPQVRELPNVAHLHTPVSGRLARRTHVLDLVDALHPTPAVGGVPSHRAVAWIRHHEPHGRGWYSGPVGWFDADGDGEFVVALRSGLVRGNRAWAYAGAGIVRGSEPGAEYAETDLKLRPLLEALGDAAHRAGEARP